MATRLAEKLCEHAAHYCDDSSGPRWDNRTGGRSRAFRLACSELAGRRLLHTLVCRNVRGTLRDTGDSGRSQPTFDCPFSLGELGNRGGLAPAHRRLVVSWPNGFSIQSELTGNPLHRIDHELDVLGQIDPQIGGAV